MNWNKLINCIIITFIIGGFLMLWFMDAEYSYMKSQIRKLENENSQLIIEKQDIYNKLIEEGVNGE